MKVLLDTYHVDVNVRNNNNGTPLHVAASQAKPEGAKILIAHKALIDARAKDGSTPLHFAAYKRLKGHFEVAKILLENGADANAKMNNGATPLDLAESMGNTETASLLRKYGAKEGQGSVGRNQLPRKGKNPGF
jgi:ankyrin repeat protein